MPIVLRIIAYNIAEGNRDGRLPPNGALPAVAEQIRGKSADIVLLNEARKDTGWPLGWPLGSGVNQFMALRDMTGLAYCGWGHTTNTGVTGWKAVGVLSRYPLLTQRVIPVMRGSSATTYATYDATVEINGLIHHIFATRFDAWSPADRASGIRQAVALIRAIDVRLPVIFGGDFNTGPGQPDFDGFARDSGLASAFAEQPDQGFVNLDHIDHVFYRGPYRVTRMEQRCVIEVANPPGQRTCPVGSGSDHPSVFVELTTPPGDSVAVHGSTIRLKHLRTVGVLHSHAFNYGHDGSSAQQQVTVFGGADGNDFWRLQAPHGSPRDYLAMQPISHGNVIRLEHVATGRNLHSHVGLPSPVTGQQEVTCFGQNGLGDENDDWRVEVDGGGPWTFGKRVRLIHVPTDHALHSHHGHSHPQWTMNQQEVTCYARRDENDWWYLTEIQPLNAAGFVKQSVPLVMEPRTTQTVSLTFRNTGVTTWNPNQGYFLGSQAPQDNQSWGRNRSLPLAAAVPPGAEHTFTFSISARTTPGDMPFQWKMVQEHVEWFGQDSPLTQIRISPKRSCAWYAQRIGEVTGEISQLEDRLTGNPRVDAGIRKQIKQRRDAIVDLRAEANNRGCVV